MECIILAGGLGTRLRAVVSDLPKCMAPVAGKPFLYYIFNYLKQHGIAHVILSVGYKHDVIKNWVEAQNLPFAVSFAVENEPLGTGGAIQLAMETASEEQIFILNGDTFFDIDLAQLCLEHKNKNADLTIALKPMAQFDRYGNVMLNEQNRITGFTEKQYCKMGQINGGIYCINRNNRLMDGLGAKFSFETEVLQRRFSDNYFHALICANYFIDIGIPDDYRKANIDFKVLFHDSDAL
ncbi:MAG: nucleotidyltransferase family protein [Desulfobacter postgatei]|uniref:nucleotidyltransferase family protein n=1 Tax=Desulfobacter postgatei TaxID=2293 RepID=UPI0023F009C4|nr:nucleotidyltransferase family protein [Desulfobacter postgatei]MDD4274330.1 nucleotidyltransferase family protein [Desulfobacter postgatei]